MLTQVSYFGDPATGADLQPLGPLHVAHARRECALKLLGDVFCDVNADSPEPWSDQTALWHGGAVEAHSTSGQASP